MTELAIISGGTGYIGSAAGDALREKGWRVISLARQAGGEDVIACDITDAQEVQKTIEYIVRAYGEISACIHAATNHVESTQILDVDPASFDASLTVAARGACLFAKAAAPHMRSEGVFIGITTKLIEPGIVAPPVGAYITAKYALRGFLRSLASDPRMKKHRVYAVAPGFLEGGLNKDLPAAVLDFFATKSGAGRTSLQEVAELIARLCIEKDAFPSGSSIALSPLECTPL